VTVPPTTPPTDRTFPRAVALILKHEGGYVNDPADPGGETNFGISKRAYPAEDIRAMTPARASAIYERDYWRRAKCDELPWPLAVQVFDMAVNAGVGPAVKMLQKVLGVTTDGVIGPKTLAAAWGSTHEQHVRYARERVNYYSALGGWPRFGRAWVIRTVETLGEALA
jgi:lysozyme family protein